MKNIFIFLLFLLATNVFAQKETFDLISYTPPTGWKKEVMQNAITYTIADSKTNSWCQVGPFPPLPGGMAQLHLLLPLKCLTN